MDANERGKSIDLYVGFYDPFSIFQGGLRADFEKYVKIKSVYWKDSNDTLRILKNICFKYIEQIPRDNLEKQVTYLKLMFVCCNNVDDYRSKIRPLIVQWLKNLEEESPKLPHFIFLFENSELKTAADKFLKTNILNKLKFDFPNVPNIYKIKSLFHTELDRDESWKLISNAIRAVLSDAINLQLLKFKGDTSKIAAIYKLLNLNDNALSCFSKSFNAIPYIKKIEFSDLEPTKICEIMELGSSLQSSDNNFMRKTFLLKRQEELLLDESLSDNAYARNVVNFAQIIIAYVNSLEMCYRRNEIAYLVISRFLENQRLNSVVNPPNGLDVIIILSNIRLLLRNELISLGTSKNYIIKGSFSVIDVQFEKEEYAIFTEKLEHLMESKKSFVSLIIDYTRDLIGIYNDNGVNMSNLANLTTELALILFYSADDYETASEQLVKSYEYFLTTGWKHIGVSLLKIYIQNLQKLITAHGNGVIVQLISSYLRLSVNNGDTLDGTSFTNLCMKLEKPLKLDSSNIFSIQNISRVYCKEVDVYCIDISLLSHIKVVVDTVVLSFTAESNKNKFSCSDVILQNCNNLILSCNEIMCGDFEIESLIFIIGNLQLEYKYRSSFNIRLIEKFVYGEKHLLRNTSTLMNVPKVRDLNSEFINLQLNVGTNCIKDAQVFIFDNPERFPINESSDIILKSNEMIDEVKLKVIKEVNVLKLIFPAHVILQAYKIYEIRIPCLLFSSTPKLSLSYEFKFDSIRNKNEYLKCSHRLINIVDTTLPLAVAANEIFKSMTTDKDDMLSKFFFLSQYTINSVSSENPVRIHKVDLSGSNSLIETWKPQMNIIAFIDQGTTFFYKISGFKDDTVLLRIEYSTMTDEVSMLIDKLFQQFLSESKFVDSKMQLRFVDAAKPLWNQIKFKYNFYALSFKIKVAEHPDNFINSAIQLLGTEDREIFSTTIHDFLIFVEQYVIDETTKLETINSSKNELRIVVDVPNVNMVTTVEYKFDRKLQYKEAVPVSVCLNVFFVSFDTDNIDNESSQREVRFLNKDGPVHLEVNFLDNEQKWIVAGIKSLDLAVDLEKASCPSGQLFEFDLTFIPLKVGKIQLPAIEIKNRSYKKYSMEIDYKNTTESVHVVSELNKVIHSF